MALAFGAQAGVVASSTAVAAPTGPTDATKVPHYFGPWPNWANSPLTLSKASVVFADPTQLGTGAQALAQVNPDGTINAVQVTASGHDYSSGTTVSIVGGTTLAQATVSISAANAVVGFKDIQPGGGYTGLAVSLDGGVDLSIAGNRAAAAAATGGVDAVSISTQGTGYTMPTVDFDYPDAPGGTQPKAHALCAEAPGDCTHADGQTVTVTDVIVDDPGSGYSTAPAVKIRNGTQFDPIALPDGSTEALATSTLKLLRLDVLDPGNGYTMAPTVTISDSGTAPTVRVPAQSP